jgi:transposase
MSGFVEGIDRSQSTLFPAMLDDYVAEDNLVRAVDAFVEGLDLGKLGFGRVAPLEKGRPAYHPATLLKIYIYGYLNCVPSSRRVERECQRNIELVWLTGIWHRISRPLLISVRTTARPFVRSVVPS